VWISVNATSTSVPVRDSIRSTSARGVAALHPFANITDPAIGALDKAICPFYAMTPLLPKVSDAMFFTLAVTSNLLLYGVIAWKITAAALERSFFEACRDHSGTSSSAGILWLRLR